MKIGNRFALALSALAVSVVAPSAGAEVVTYNGLHGILWSTALNWDSPSGPHVPTSADRVVIPSDLACTIHIGTSVAADTVDIEGALHIGAGATLTLTNTHDNIAGTPDNSIVNGSGVDNGLLSLEAGSPGGELDITSASHTFAGTGKIVGSLNSTIMIIGYNIRLTNQLATTGNGIRGAGLTIDGANTLTPAGPSFHNEGIVAGQNGNVVVLGASIGVQDIAGAQWNAESTTVGSGLQFQQAAWLNGDFTGICGSGHFTFNATVETCGTFTRNGSTVTVNGTGNTFEYYKWVVGTPSTCSNPGTSMSMPTCSSTTNGWVVTHGTYTGCACP